MSFIWVILSSDITKFSLRTITFYHAHMGDNPVLPHYLEIDYYPPFMKDPDLL